MAGQMSFNRMAPTSSPVKLNPLRRGDSISLVAPSSPFDREDFLKASQRLESRGYRLNAGKHVFDKDGYLAGSDCARVEDLIQAMTDPATTAILCIRGGYGSIRLLEWLPFAFVSRNPKIFLGYSDITFLHAAFHSRLNWITFHGPNLIELFVNRGLQADSVFDTLEGKKHFLWNIDENQILRHGVACGKIIGGNLTCFTHLIGTPHLPDPSGALLFLEDRGEAAYRVDRALAQLKLAGILERISGVILGSFHDCGPPEEIWKRVLEHTQYFSFPIVCGLPFGHGPENEILPLGLPFLLDTRGGILEACESPFLENPAEKTKTSVGNGSNGAAHARFRAVAAQHEPEVAALDGLFLEALQNRIFSAASLLVADSMGVLFCRTWGHNRYGGNASDERTLFDLASLTKALLVAPMMMQAVGRGLLNLEDSLERFFPSTILGANHRSITLRQLLSHTSGFPAYEPFYRRIIGVAPQDRKDLLLDLLLQEPLVSTPGSTCRYSDLGFILLGLLLEMVCEKPLMTLAEEFFANCSSQLAHSGFHQSPRRDAIFRTLRPEMASLYEPIQIAYFPLLTTTDPTVTPGYSYVPGCAFAATEYCSWRNRLLQGEVHDENAYCLEGVAGHAGLFGTSRGVFWLLWFLWHVYLGKIEGDGWSQDVVEVFWTRQRSSSDCTWSLGFDTPSPACSSTGSLFSPHSVGHLGFTGTSFWLDLDQERLVILLTNRVHPSRENERIRVFRPILHNLVMETFYG